MIELPPRGRALPTAGSGDAAGATPSLRRDVGRM